MSGPWADRSRRYWRLTVVGYAMTAVCVPLLAVTPLLGAAGVAVASTLILLERVGKAVRSPAKSALLARMAASTGRGRGFAVHKALDQVGRSPARCCSRCRRRDRGAVAGPRAARGAGRAVDAAAGPAAPAGPVGRGTGPRGRCTSTSRASGRLWDGVLGADLPREFHLFSLAVACSTAGLMTFGVISFRFVDAGLVPLAAVPLVYAGAMAVEAVAALATGDLFDRYGGRVLLAVPLVVVTVPPLVFAPALWPVLRGVVLWGAATGIQDSTVKAYVADLVPSRRRSTAYGVFAAVQGVGALVGGTVAGALATTHAGVLAWCVAGLQATSLLLLLRSLRGTAKRPR